MSAPSAIRAGAPSPMGEPLAMLPPRCRRGAPAGWQSAATARAGRAPRHQGGPGVFQRDGGADPEPALAALERTQLRHAAGVDQRAQLAELLVHPKADVGRAGQQARARRRCAGSRQCGPRSAGLEAKKTGRSSGVSAASWRKVASTGARWSRCGGAWKSLEPGIEDGAVARAAAQVAGQRVSQLLSGGHAASGLMAFVGAGHQAHHEARGAEAALRGVAAHHRLLHGCSCSPVPRSSTVSSAAVQRGQELGAGIDVAKSQLPIHVQLGLQHRRHRSHPRRSLPWCRCSLVLAQVLQHGGGGGQAVHLGDLAAMEEAKGRGVMGGLDSEPRRRIRE